MGISTSLSNNAYYPWHYIFAMKFIRKKRSLYRSYKDKYGAPELTAFGEHTWGTGEKFVKDAKTGKILKRTPEVCYLGRSGKAHFYIGPKSKLKEGDVPKPSFGV